MIKRWFLGMLLSVGTVVVYGQWERKDSLRLQDLLQREGEIQLNPDVLRDMDMGQINKPMMQRSNNIVEFDMTLPKPFPEKRKIVLTLSPYKANTKFNYDPIYQQKIKVGPDTWKASPVGGMPMEWIYANWAKTPEDAGYRETLEQIEATGLRYDILANGGQGQWKRVGGPTGNDLMAPFTKEFWDKKGRKRRARTLEVLSHYGDSTTVVLREEIIK